MTLVLKELWAAGILSRRIVKDRRCREAWFDERLK
jgi:hypothetical protein